MKSGRVENIHQSVRSLAVIPTAYIRCRDVLRRIFSTDHKVIGLQYGFTLRMRAIYEIQEQSAFDAWLKEEARTSKIPDM
jgi:hypothetical protein